MSRAVSRTLKLMVWGLVSVSLLGCVRGCPSSRPPIHVNPNMDWQPKYKAQQESGFFYDGATMRAPVAGTVARGQLRDDTRFFTGRDEAGEFLTTSPVAEAEVLARGAERFDIYCRPCHGARGNGKGILSERGGVPVPSFSEQRIVDLPDGEIFEVITLGKGLMPGYAYPIPPADRWAIITHVRHLQEEARAVELALGGGVEP